MPRWLNLPNAITVARLVLIPPILYAIVEGNYRTALILFIVAGLTDLLDGAAARRLGSTSQAGAYLDPIADKCLLGGVFLALAWARIVPWWYVALVFGRDLFILLGAGALMLTSPVRKFPPSRWGKLSTFFQIGCAVVWMVRNTVPGLLMDALAAFALWNSAAFTLVSGVDYARRGVRIARARYEIDGGRAAE